MIRGLLLTAVLAVFLPGYGSAQDAAAPSSQQYFDGRNWRTIWTDERELMEFNASPMGETRIRQSVPRASVGRLKGSMRIWNLPQGTDALSFSRQLRQSEPGLQLSPVFYTAPGGGIRMALGGGVLVRFKDDWDQAAIDRWFEDHQLADYRPLAGRGALYRLETAAGMEALELANRLQKTGEVEYALPDWWQELYPR